jgi:Cu/Ag efflux protein CusF
MSLQRLLPVSFLVIGSAVLVLPFQSFASKHTKKTTPDAEKRQGQTHHPIGWRFTMPKGDAAKGRAVFEKFECHYCHEVRGESFPSPTENAPELSQMGGLHPVEFFAESIMNPNAVVPKTYRDSDGKSPMTNFAEKMTVQELIDVSAYVASLKPKGAPKSVSAQGQVVALVPENGEIVLTHGEITGFMEAMTMGYKVSSPSLLKIVKPGDSVQFTIDTERRVITKIAKSQAAQEKKQ